MFHFHANDPEGVQQELEWTCSTLWQLSTYELSLQQSHALLFSPTHRRKGMSSATVPSIILGLPRLSLKRKRPSPRLHIRNHTPQAFLRLKLVLVALLAGMVLVNVFLTQTWITWMRCLLCHPYTRNSTDWSPSGHITLHP